jgi:hypothetical protein
MTVLAKASSNLTDRPAVATCQTLELMRWERHQYTCNYRNAVTMVASSNSNIVIIIELVMTIVVTIVVIKAK